ncbi:hypothetical protein ACFL4B_00410 [Candidatus Neomarinimicrobiota bacterium]
MNKIDKKYPEGHFVGKWMGLCIAICSIIGIPLSVIAKSPGLIGIGPAIGVAIGVAIGSSIEGRYKKAGRIRPLTKQERYNKNIAVFAGIVLFLLGCAVFILLFLKNI